MTKTINTLFLSLLLGACSSGDSDDLQLDGLSAPLKRCVERGADENGYQYADDITKLTCSIVDPVTDDIGQLTRYSNLSDLVIVMSGSAPSIRLTGFDNLESFKCSGCELGEFSLGGEINQKLSVLEISSSEGIARIDLEGAEKLTALTLLADVDNLILPFAGELTTFSWTGHWLAEQTDTQIQNLELATELVELNIQGVPIEYLDLSNANELESVNTLWTSLKAAYFNSQVLESVSLISGQLTDVEFVYPTQLSSLSLADNQITDINLDHATSLSFLSLNSNPLTDDTKAYLESLDWIETVNF